MSGERNLARLLATMSPKLNAGEFVFCTFEDSGYGAKPELEPIASILEPEGLTLIIPKQSAVENGLKFESTFRCISLQVLSSLEAVGLTAAFSTKLAEHGISANVIAGFYHDHIFVQSDSAEQAITALLEI